MDDDAALRDRARVLGEQARAWRDDDPDPVTRAELDGLLSRWAAGDPAAGDDLRDRFSGPLEFGTAGLRGALGAGPHRMNRAVVIRAAAGLAAHLIGAEGEVNPPLPVHVPVHVVVGYDARHQSDVFARDTCAVLVAAGCTASLLPRALPTPVLAFAVRHLSADAGVMVTASHNPPQDNGYKVYLGGGDGGAQIVPPSDAQIAARIAAVPGVAAVPRAGSGWAVLGEDLIDAYLAAAVSVVRPSTGDGAAPRELDVVLTPLHGVGGEIVVRALRSAGFAQPYVVPEQAAPDPDFPTVAFPNPEEPGAIDLAVAAARARGADLVIANDPDADRCAVAVPDGSTWRMLRGDELGALLAEHVLSRRQGAGGQGADGQGADGQGDRSGVVACSIVSSQLLARIAAAHGVGYRETLTGFKWIARVPGLVYGYEEALGYCVAPDLVRDKDGVTAALLVAELAASLKASGRTLLGALDDLALAHGVHATDQLSIRVESLPLIAATMARLRAHPPGTLAGQTVSSVEDLAAPEPDGLPPTDGLRYRTDGGLRVVVRPSGTEPKLKCYLEVVVPLGGDSGAGAQAALPIARAQAAGLLAAARSDLSELLAGPAAPAEDAEDAERDT